METKPSVTALEGTSVPVSVAVRRRILAKDASQMDTAVRDFLAFSAGQAGYEGMQVLRIPAGANIDYTLVARFRDQRARDEFKAQPAYSNWVARLDGFAVDSTGIHERTGLEGWFTLPGVAEGPPPWKMAVATWIGVNAVTTPLLLFLPKVLAPLGFPWGNFAFNVVVVVALTWVVMPLLVRVGQGWLYQTQQSPNSKR
jgi:antibiotic biosynthesis monooxygenase (ABM) superfamily enzyme